MRTDFHHRVHPQPRQGLDAGAESHRRTHLPPPVRRIQGLARSHRPSAEIADEGERGRRKGKLREGRLQLVHRRLDHGAVVSGTLPQARDANARRLQLLEDRGDLRRRTADHLVRPIVGGDAQGHALRGRIVLVQRLRDAGGRREHRRHRALAGQRPDQPPAQRRNAQAVLQAEHARGVRRGDLSQAVSKHHLGSNSEARPQRRQGAFECVDRRLLPSGIVQVPRGAGTSEHHVEQRGAAFFPERFVAPVEHRAHHRLACVERRAHAGPLTGLPGIDEGHPRRLARYRSFVRFGDCPQALTQRLRVVKHHSRAVAEVAPPVAGRPGHVRKQGLGRRALARKRLHLLVEPFEIASRDVAKRSPRLSRERQQARRARGKPILRARRRYGRRQRNRDRSRSAGDPFTRIEAGPGFAGRGVSLQHDVGVRPRPSEPAHPRQRRTVGIGGPWRRSGSHPQRQPTPVHGRIRVPEVQVPGDHSPIHRQHGLDQSRGACRRFQVADVGLDRADQQRAVRVAPTPVDGRRRVDLDRVAHLRPGPVRLQVVDIRWVDRRPLERRRDHAFLRLPVGNRQARARPVLVQRRAPNHPPDAVAAGLCIGEPSQDQDAAALAPDVPVGGGVEGLALAVRRQHPRVGAKLEKPAGENDIHPSRKREVRVTPLEPRDGLVRCDQGRRAGGVHRHRRPPEAQREGDTPDRGIERRAGDGIETGGRFGGPRTLPGFQDQPPVVVVADACVNAGTAVLQPLGIDACVFERPPARFKNQPLLRVQQLRFDRRNAEEGGVETVEIIEIGAEAAGVDLSRVLGEQLAYATDAGPRNALLHRVPAGFQQTPEGGDVLRPGKAAGHADDRNRRAGPGRLRRARPRDAVRLFVEAVVPVCFCHREALSVSE